MDHVFWWIWRNVYRTNINNSFSQKYRTTRSNMGQIPNLDFIAFSKILIQLKNIFLVFPVSKCVTFSQNSESVTINYVLRQVATLRKKSASVPANSVQVAALKINSIYCLPVIYMMISEKPSSLQYLILFRRSLQKQTRHVHNFWCQYKIQICLTVWLASCWNALRDEITYFYSLDCTLFFNVSVNFVYNM